MKTTTLCIVTGLLLTLGSQAAELGITLDPASPGGTFEGIGALSAGASSRQLMEYPEPQRSQVLDFLFKPKFGAAFQHLKVEIGGDMNSTDGTEPSHARTRAELEHPQPECFDRGYEWWLLREARRRNPAIFTDILQWGAPGWIGQGKSDSEKFFSQDNADFIASFIQGARQYHGVDINYCGIWNETPHNRDWIKLLRRTLDRAGIARVQIVASDQVGQDPWRIAREMRADPELMSAVQVIGAHYVGFKSTPESQATGKRVWASEDGPWRGDWQGARQLARVFNRNYVQGRMTKTVIWSLITAYYETLPLPNSGPMMAKEPWSGHYEVQPATWAVAHTTQFAQPGWKYMDSACVLLPGGGSCVALRNPSSPEEYSIVVETMDAREPQTLRFRMVGGFPRQPLHVWRSSNRRQFEPTDDVSATGDSFTLTVERDSIYSLTTTTGQQKGVGQCPPAAEFPLPYADDFEAGAVGKYARYFSDQGGVFEICKRPDGAGQALRQAITGRNIEWPGHPTPEPYSLIGSPHWRNYKVTCDARVETAGAVSVWGRVTSSPQTADPAKGYWLRVDTDGHWALRAFTRALAAGQTDFRPGIWHKLDLRFLGRRITGLLDNVELATVEDFTYTHGQAGVGTGWNEALFDTFSIQPLSGPEPPELINLARNAQASASSQWDDQFSAHCAIDGNPQTRWNSAPGKLTNEWVELNFGKPVRFTAVHIVQFMKRVTRYQVQYHDRAGWRTALSAAHPGEDEWVDAFPPVESDRLRLVVLEVAGQDPQTSTPSLYEVEVLAAPDPAGASPETVTRTWNLSSGPVECRLQQRDGAVYLRYLGPAGRPDWPAAAVSLEGACETCGRVEGQALSPANLALTDSQMTSSGTGADQVRFSFRHRFLPLDMEVGYTKAGETGVFVRQVHLANHGTTNLHVESLPSLAWRLPAGAYDLDYLWGGWGQERQLMTERLGPGTRSFVSDRGRSTRLFSPWFCLRNQALGTRFMAQLAWSGNWQMQFDRPPTDRPIEDDPLRAELGVRFDFGGSLTLAPGHSYAAPPVAFTATAGDLDDAANQLHRYQRRFVAAHPPGNGPLLVQFNSWYPFPGKLTIADMKRCLDVAAELGAEVFVLDAGWFNKIDWSGELGDWQADPVAFPNGLKELSDQAHQHGLKFGLWLEIENLWDRSQMFRQHPDWCLSYQGKPVQNDHRSQLDFARPDAREWAYQVVDGLVRELGLDWIKIDYNIDIGERFDCPDTERGGGMLSGHILSYYAWLDRLRAAHPQLVIENCSSGGMRFDLGILAHTHTTWLSDMVDPIRSVQLAYGSTLEFLPEVCNHWMVGDSANGHVDLAKPPGWWDFMLRVPMNGQFGISSRVFDWNPQLKQHAARAIRDYKRLRRTIQGADVYHLTPPPSRNDPEGWLGLEYVSAERQRALLLAYRLERSPREFTFRLRGLAPDLSYTVTFDGEARGRQTGRQLADPGLIVSLDAEWRAALIELEATGQL
jgi:galactosylceramidase